MRASNAHIPDLFAEVSIGLYVIMCKAFFLVVEVLCCFRFFELDGWV
jgi:hypothetical protein